jgi:competence protein ComEA
MTTIFTSRERKVILFLSFLFLVGNSVRLYKAYDGTRDSRTLDLGSLEPADSSEVMRLFESSRELRHQRENVRNVEFPIDINRADFWDLVALPGIGPERAKKIMDLREKKKGFRVETDLLEIPGIGEKTLETLRDYIHPIAPGSEVPETDNTIGINLNGASRAQLETLPGIGPVLAERIVTYRERHGSFRSLEEVMGVRGIGEDRFRDLEPLLSIGDEPNNPAEPQ